MMAESESCIDEEQIDLAIQVILELAKNKRNDLTAAIEAEPILLQLCFMKIPNVQNQVVKINLPNSLVTDSSDICLFVKDADKNVKDYEPTVRQYKELLETHGIKKISEIIPLKALKLEYKPYEAKRNLCNRFDMFLADERIVRLLSDYLGAFFLKKRKRVIQVNVRAKNLNQEIDKALHKTQCTIGGSGSVCLTKVANTRMSQKQIADNVRTVIDSLSKNIPGGAINIKKLHLKTQDSPALLVYESGSVQNEVHLPKIARQTEEVFVGDVSTVKGGLVRVSAQGDITVLPPKNTTIKTRTSKASKANKGIDNKSQKKTPNKRKHDSDDSKKGISEPPKKKRKSTKKAKSVSKKSVQKTVVVKRKRGKVPKQVASKSSKTAIKKPLLKKSSFQKQPRKGK